MRTDSAELRIRPRHAGDDAFIDALSERVFAAYARDPRNTTRSIVQDRAAETRIGELGTMRVGFVVVELHRLERNFGPWSRPVVARVNAIAVRPDAQGRGIGRSLLAAAEAIARAHDARSLSLMTAERNGRARRLFESAGFSTLAPIEDAYRNGQRGIAMIKAL
jgi:ribosomal protein S18 acetylase RimI-like enzyme